MFALRTPTRMRGSAIVQGLKSWASAIHPQLPLSRKESQRLLTALTSSFRRHLDEAHPPPDSSDARPTVEQVANVGGKVERTERVHSSAAAYADKHLASVLTSPLIAQGRIAKKPNAATVKAELAADLERNPIDLLEDYQTRGLASIPIAWACLEAFNESLKTLSEAERKIRIAKTQPGNRILSWLWDNKHYQHSSYSEDPRLADLMVPLVIQEGNEERLWKWMSLDVDVHGEAARQNGVQISKKFRWKGDVVRNIAKFSINSTQSLDGAVQTYIKALRPNSSLGIPFGAVLTLITKTMIKDEACRMATRPESYEDFFAEFNESGMWGYIWRMPCLQCHLAYPGSRSPLLALKVFRQAFDPAEHCDNTPGIRNVLDTIPERRLAWILTRAAALLEDMGRSQDARWLETVAIDQLPPHTRRFRQLVKEERELYTKEDREYKRLHSHTSPPTDVPTFKRSHPPFLPPEAEKKTDDDLLASIPMPSFAT